MLRLLRCHLAAAILILPLNAMASQDDAGLWQHPEWQALLHINRGATLHSRGQSYVDDPGFFLSEQGAEDARAELDATVAALAQEASEERCRFPARYRFLARELGWPSSEAGLAHCADYLAWRAEIPSARAVLVFPASYLNSPSSMFGHTLLRLDASDDPETVWNSWAVNFGAVTSEQDNSLLYVYRGLAGGYPGRFVIVPYVNKVQEYSHMENRDIWEYNLALTDEELQRLIDHLWELQDINFDYYFFDENCSFRLLELLDVARPGEDIIEGFRFAEVPVNTVRTLYDETLVASVHYRPSKAVELQSDIDQLSFSERRLAAKLLRDHTVSEREPFVSYPPARKHLMARTAYRSLRLRERKSVRSKDVAKTSFSLLRIMNANETPDEQVPARPIPPERGHGTQMAGLGGGQFADQDFGEIYYRFTYHDLIDNNAGFLRGAQIEGFDFRLRSTDSDELKLQSLDVVHIRSLAPRNRFVKPLSWYVHGGLERTVANNEYLLASFIQGGAGFSWGLGPMQPYLLATARLENNSEYSPLLEGGGGANIGALWYFSWLQVNTSVEGLYFGNDDYRHRWQADFNLPLGRQNALRLEWQRDGWRGGAENGYTLAWRHYFD